MSKNCRCSFYFDNYHIKSLIKSNVVKYLTDLGIIPVVYCQKATQIDAGTTYEMPKKKKGVCKFRKRKFEGFVGSKGDVILDLMPKKVATLRTGQMVKIPVRLQILCNFVLKNAEVEEIFIKPGHQIKQENIKAVLNKGEALPADANPVDVAQIILQFLKELPVPVIPECQHQFLLTCYDHADREDVLPLACLLLPPNHVNLLAYLMQFFEQISTHHKRNKMTVATLGKCVGPLIMPVNAPEDIKKVVNIMVTLMRRADLIGMVPELMTLEPKPSRRRRSWVESLLKRC
ncbi:unnamed protein product [Phyllotreta striolata]|uniref:Rho-GAP domain-containing protein n=1 Tax=Phyllotreta striolata TaxID=444603 RepID=A0A9N9TPM8_PHYSR|nr:unnamed protein product [Phyllotreta striolata]